METETELRGNRVTDGRVFHVLDDYVAAVVWVALRESLIKLNKPTTINNNMFC